MKKKRNNYLTLLLFLTLISLVSLIFDKEIMGFYQLNALSLSSLSLPAISQSTIIIVASVLLVILVALVVVWLLRRANKINGKNNDGQEILVKTEAQEQIIDKSSPIQSIDVRLAQYVRDARVAGLSDEIILGKLRESGWPEEIIKQAL